MSSSQSRSIQLRIPPNDVAAIDAAATEAGENRSEYMIRAALMRLSAKDDSVGDEIRALLDARGL